MGERPVLFCHGLESAPHGRKFHALAEHFEVDAPDCRGRDLAARVSILRNAIVERMPTPLVVGSSFGGIAGLLAALVARPEATIPGLVLCAPALHLEPPPGLDVQIRCPAPTIVVHGRADEVIPIDVSRRFAASHGAELIEVDDDHSLAGSLDVIVDAVQRLMARS